MTIPSSIGASRGHLIARIRRFALMAAPGEKRTPTVGRKRSCIRLRAVCIGELAATACLISKFWTVQNPSKVALCDASSFQSVVRRFNV